MSYSSPGPGIRTWHVVVAVGLVILVADVVSLQVMSPGADRFTRAPEPAQPPAPRVLPRPAAPVETVEVLVAAKDLPVGTMITRDELDKMVKTKKVPKEGLPGAVVTERLELVDRRLARPIRAEETFDPRDLIRGPIDPGPPPGRCFVSISLNVNDAAGGFVGPGNKVDVLATVRRNNRLLAFPLVIDALVCAVDTQIEDLKAPGPSARSSYSLAVTEKEALVLALAKARGCRFELLLVNPARGAGLGTGNDPDAVIELLSDLPAGDVPVAPAVAPAPRPVADRR